MNKCRGGRLYFAAALLALVVPINTFAVDIGGPTAEAWVISGADAGIGVMLEAIPANEAPHAYIFPGPDPVFDALDRDTLLPVAAPYGLGVLNSLIRNGLPGVTSVPSEIGYYGNPGVCGTGQELGEYCADELRIKLDQAVHGGSVEVSFFYGSEQAGELLQVELWSGGVLVASTIEGPANNGAYGPTNPGFYTFALDEDVCWDEIRFIGHAAEVTDAADFLVEGMADLNVCLKKELTSGPDRDGSVSFDDFSSTDGLTLNVDAAQVGSALRLVPNEYWQVGSAFTASPMTLGPAASFSTNFSFQISNSGDGGADGLTFTVHNAPAEDLAIGGLGGDLGYSGIPNSLTIEFDSWDNGAAFGDPDGNHVGTATNGIVGNGNAVPLGGAPLDGGTVFYAWVDYDGIADQLEVRLATTDVRPAAPTLAQAGIGLAGLLGGTSAYAGFTSATGAAYSDHDILSWNFTSAIDLVVPINVPIPTAYDFTITWGGDGNTPVWIYDRVPAEWDVTHVEFDGNGLPLDCAENTSFIGDFGLVEVERGGKSGKNCNSDTDLRWMPGEDNTLNVQTLARCHDNRGNTFCRPTSCGALYLNYGAVAFDELGNFVAGPTQPLCLAAVADVNGDAAFTWDGTGDEDADGISDYEEACGIGTDPCMADTDGDGVIDGADACPFEGPPAADTGQVQDPDGCNRQSQCSDGIDNEGDGVTDYPADASCDSLLDDSENTLDVAATDP